MKSLQFLCLATLFFTLSTTAQITKGNFMVGGSGSLSFVQNKSNNNQSGTSIDFTEKDSYSVLLEPSIGYFIYDKFAFGTKLNYSNSAIEGNGLAIKNSVLSINPFLRYYFLNTEKSFNVFFEPSIAKYLNKSLGNSIGYSLKAGHVVFFNSSVGLETSINYQYNQSDQVKRDIIFIGIGFQIHLEKNK